MPAIGTVSILGAQSAVGCVLVDHGVHTAWSYAEEQTWSAQLLEVTEVAVPVRLWHDSYPQPLSLQCAAYHRRSE